MSKTYKLSFKLPPEIEKAFEAKHATGVPMAKIVIAALAAFLRKNPDK